MSMQADGQKFAERLRSLPQLIERHVKPVMASSADEIVRAMQSLAPNHLKNKISWTWGAPPAGTTVMLHLGEADVDDFRITIYCSDRRAHWWEFGTADRYQKTTGRYSGRITAQPFFYPAFRLLRAKSRRRIRTAVRKAIKEAMSK